MPAERRGEHDRRPLERPRRARRGDRASTSSPRSSPSPTRRTWASSPPAEGFLELLRERADDNGALLVFDEVISGFRVGPGGAQGLTGVIPDLTIMGKVIGGGLPAAAYGGPRELMRRIAPAGDVYQAGTLSGNPLAVAAGLATLALLDGEQPYLKLAATTAALAEGLAGAAAAAGYEDVQIATAPGLLTVFFSAEPVTRLRAARRPATSTPTPPGVAACSRAASTRPRRSSRPGFRRSPTRPSTSRAPSPRRPPRSRSSRA